jgi:uncharacterized protein (TIGR03435 family)
MKLYHTIVLAFGFYLVSAQVVPAQASPALASQGITPPPSTVPSQSGASATTFDVASIHPNNTATDGHPHIYSDPAESHFRTVNLSIKSLIQFAYAIPESQILNAPVWLDSTLFDIDAKAGTSVDAQLRALPKAEARLQKQRMVQALLADRFHLAAHQETRQLPIYALVAAKGGPKFQPSQIDGTTIDTGQSHMHIAGSDDTLAILARELAQVLGRVVVNQTGVNGRFDLKLRWTPDDAPPPLLNGGPDPNAPPGIFTAIQEQLGLKLEPSKGPVPVLVIDRVDPPTEN